MKTREEVNEIVSKIVVEDYVDRWWDLSIPRLGGRTPNEVWEDDPEAVVELAESYLDPSYF